MDKEKLAEIFLRHKGQAGSIPIQLLDKEERLGAWIIHNLAVHKTYQGEDFTISHLHTGLALIKGFKELRFALSGVRLMYYMLEGLDDPFECKTKTKIGKNRVANRCFKFLNKYMKVWNNLELEKLVGAFYADRHDCEQLRFAINPDKPREYLDPYSLSDERTVTDMIMNSL